MKTPTREQQRAARARYYVRHPGLAATTTADWRRRNWQRVLMHHTWANMVARCYSAKHHGYHNYGGRGVLVCKEWLGSFEQFLTDVGYRPLGPTRFTLDRRNNGGDYEHNNVRWATSREQRLNRRTVVVEMVDVVV